MSNVKIFRYTKKLFVMILIFTLFIPSIITYTIAKDSNFNDSYIINNPINIGYKYADIDVLDDLVFLSTFGDSWEIWDISNPKKSFLVKEISYISGDSGYEYVVPTNMEIVNDYLYINYLDKITIYDLIDPTNPNYIASIECPFSSIMEIHIENNFLYLLQRVVYTEYATSALAILNISEFNTIQLLGVYNSSIHQLTSNWYDVGESFIIKDDFVYLVCSGDIYPVDVDSVLEIIDISNKSNPQKKGEYVLPSRPYSIGLRDNFAFIPTYQDCLQIIDCSNPGAPLNVSKFESTERIENIEIHDNVGYLALANKLVILDISDIDNIIPLGEYTLSNQGHTYFHNLEVYGDIIYTIGPSQYDDRYFFIFDCSDLSNPTKLYPKGIRISGDVLFTLTIISMYAGIILGPIIIIIGLYFIVKKLKQRRLKAFQNEAKS